MILKPDDVMQKGDIIHYTCGSTLVVKGTFDGMRVSGLWNESEELRTAYDHVERPDPKLDYREQVRVLREALENINDIVKEEYRILHQVYTDEQPTTANLKHALKIARSALEATK